MLIYFGLELDDLVFPQNHQTQGGIHHCGPQKLLNLLESPLGLSGHASNNEHLRIEQYRQALQWCLQQNPTAFYARSFEADQLAAATTLLQMRDELLLANWDFQFPESEEIPERLKILALVESRFSRSSELVESDLSTPLSPGYADRFHKVLHFLPQSKIDIQQIFLNEPLDLLPSHFQQLFALLQLQGTTLEEMTTSTSQSNSDLGVFQKILSRQFDRDSKPTLKNDGSLLLLKAKRETDAANFLARFFRHNPHFRPLCLIPEKNRALDNALIQDGLPSLGILSASLARPSLQILKLIATFLWEPIDPYKILEFVTLAVKPLEEELGRRIASQMAAIPGMKGEGWSNMLRIYFEELNERALQDSSLDPHQIRQQYEFWFERPRFSASGTVPRSPVIDIFSELQRWAYKAFEESGSKNSSFLVLSEQARRVTDMLEALPEKDSQLSQLELERIIRTIYEPSPITFKEREVGHLAHIHHSSAIIAPTDDLLWWNFTRNEPNYFFSRWYQAEVQYLVSKEVQLWSPKDANALLLWQRPRPVFHCRQRLLLVIPHQIDGSEVYPHPLHDELEACFGDLSPITYDLDKLSQQIAFEQHFSLPEKVVLPARRLGIPQPFLQIDQADKLVENEKETFTSLDSLFYYPYQWVFRQKAKWRQSSILSIISDVALKGNLAHRLFEWLLKEEGILQWDRQQTEAWVQRRAPALLAREGTVLLMYGREPDRISFINRIKTAAWTLLSMIQNNGWTVMGTEVDLSGTFMGIEVKGKADVILQRGEESAILDLKWRGASRRENLIRNEADLQLVMYSRLHQSPNRWAHTAYFIIENGVMIARNQLAFKEARAVTMDADHLEVNERIWERMQATFRWRMAQLHQGKIELRTETTLQEIEEAYADEDWLELLELPSGNAPFDDYRTLINLID